MEGERLRQSKFSDAPQAGPAKDRVLVGIEDDVPLRPVKPKSSTGSGSVDAASTDPAPEEQTGEDTTTADAAKGTKDLLNFLMGSGG